LAPPQPAVQWWYPKDSKDSKAEPELEVELEVELE
jgi:hypothetical protein